MFVRRFVPLSGPADYIKTDLFKDISLSFSINVCPNHISLASAILPLTVATSALALISSILIFLILFITLKPSQHYHIWNLSHDGRIYTATLSPMGILL